MIEGLKRFLFVVYWYFFGLLMIKYVYKICNMVMFKLNDFNILCDKMVFVLFCI